MGPAGPAGAGGSSFSEVFIQTRGEWGAPYVTVSGALNPTIMPIVDQTSAPGLYNPTTGYFTVPSTGTYLFSWSARFFWRDANATTNHPGADVGLYLNDSTALALAQTGSTAAIGMNRWQITAKSWIVKLTAGDRLSLRCRDGGVTLYLHQIDMQGMRIA